MKNILLFSFSILLLSSCGKINDEPIDTPEESPVNWTAAADSSSQSLANGFWNSGSSYFNYNNSGNTDFHYWPQAHGLDVLIDAYDRTGNSLYKNEMNQWFIGVKIKNGNTFYNNFYDDMEWNALAMLRAYNSTKDEKFKTATLDVWANIQTGWNSTMDGGIAWKKDQLYYKNTPANAPACILAARLYKQFNGTSDLEWAKKIYSWMKDHLYEAGTGFVYDGINRENTGAKDNWKFTYNQGTFIGAALELYNITGEKVYLNDAIKAADYALNNNVKSNDRILQSEGTGDGGLFKGIFVRYFTQLILCPELEAGTRTRYVRFMEHNATTLWNEGTYKQSVLFGSYWKTKPSAETGLTEQLSGCMLMEAMALLKEKSVIE